jgi:uncharacterized protein
MQLLKDTYEQQARLAEYCREGNVPDLIGVKYENLPHYRRLVFNIVSDIIETAYPITYSFLPKETWDKLVYDYFAEHKCKNAQVWRMPLEFYEYCKEKDIAGQLNLPFLNDVLYVEWLELEVHTMEDIEYPAFVAEGDIFNDRIALNPEYKLIQLTYPVHTTAPTSLPGKEGTYFLLIYREKETGNVQFVDLSMLYAYILEQISLGELLKDILVEANNLFQLNNISLLKEHAENFIKDLQERKFILGFLK